MDIFDMRNTQLAYLSKEVSNSTQLENVSHKETSDLAKKHSSLMHENEEEADRIYALKKDNEVLKDYNKQLDRKIEFMEKETNQLTIEFKGAKHNIEANKDHEGMSNKRLTETYEQIRANHLEASKLQHQISIINEDIVKNREVLEFSVYQSKSLDNMQGGIDDGIKAKSRYLLELDEDIRFLSLKLKEVEEEVKMRREESAAATERMGALKLQLEVINRNNIRIGIILQNYTRLVKEKNGLLARDLEILYGIETKKGKIVEMMKEINGQMAASVDRTQERVLRAI